MLHQFCELGARERLLAVHERPLGLGVDLEHDGFVSCPNPVAPTQTASEGVFVAGCAAGPKDIVDSIVEAGAAASVASRYLAETRGAAAKTAG